jgi:hypothetical protein
MNYRYALFTILGISLIVIQTFAQSRIKLEFYGGPHLMYQNSENEFQNKLNYHLGIAGLVTVKDGLQVVLQAESARANFQYDFYPNFPSLNSALSARYYDSFGNYRIGLRKSWEKGSKSFFIQPNVGFTVNNYFDFSFADSASFFTAIRESKNIVNVGLETGVKFYTGRRNYITVGLRHQSGLSQLNSAVAFTDFSARNRSFISRSGSYTGFFVGYGIDFKGRTQEEKDAFRLSRVDRKEERRKSAWGDGVYLSIAGALRFRPTSERVPNLGFSHITSGYQYLLGYTRGRFSLESGYGRQLAYNHLQIPGEVVQTQQGYSLGTIPLRVRYHKIIGEKNRLRLGSSVAGLVTLGTRGLSNIGQGGGNGNGFIVYRLESTPLEQTSQGKIFFNAGLFAELAVFNSSMLTFNMSRNFGSPRVGRENITGTIYGRPINQELTGTLDGWLLEVGYKIPLTRFFD